MELPKPINTLIRFLSILIPLLNVQFLFNQSIILKKDIADVFVELTVYISE